MCEAMQGIYPALTVNPLPIQALQLCEFSPLAPASSVMPLFSSTYLYFGPLELHIIKMHIYLHL